MKQLETISLTDLDHVTGGIAAPKQLWNAGKQLAQKSWDTAKKWATSWPSGAIKD